MVLREIAAFDIGFNAAVDLGKKRFDLRFQQPGRFHIIVCQAAQRGCERFLGYGNQIDVKTDADGRRNRGTEAYR